jgi:3-keto-5-aminohexanoate cleavage enzyme
MNPKEILEKYRDLKVVEVVRYDPDIYCDIASIPKWEIPKKVVLGVALTGSFIDKRQNPNQPCTTTEIVNEAFACIEAGATYLHFHVRDEKGLNVGDLERYSSVVKPIREKYGDKVFIDGCPVFGKNFEEACSPLTEGLFEIGIVNPVCTFVTDNVRWLTPAAIRAQCEYFQALGKKVMVSVHDTASIDNINRFLIKTGLLQKPYYFIILPDLPGAFYMPNSRAMVEGMTLLVNRLKELDPDCQIIVCASGRASIYLGTLAILMGLHLRVGSEDTLWRYPHREEKLESSLQAFRMAKAICEMLGREIATAEEYRKIIGIK